MPSGTKSRRSSPHQIGRRNSRSRRDGIRRVLSLSSSDSDSNSGDTKEPEVEALRGRQQGQTRSPSLSSNSSGSSIDSPVDRRRQRAEQSRRQGSGRLFTKSEERAIAKSLRRKLLVNNGKRLTQIEGLLFRADKHRRASGDGDAGWVTATAFADAMAADGKAYGGRGGGARVTRDETLWLSEKLESRDGKKVACFRIRALLGGGGDSSEAGTSRRGDGQSHRNNSARGWREQSRERDKVDQKARNVDGREAKRGNDDDSNSWDGYVDDPDGGRSGRPAKWAVEQGTVGQWLQNVASPMENKLFYEFVKGLEKFEHRNGLDHYRARATHNTGCGNGRNPGTTTVHLGPMLKAAIRFYV